MSLRPQWQGYHTNPGDQRHPPQSYRRNETPFARIDDLSLRRRELALRDGTYNTSEDYLANRMLYPRPPPLLNNSRVYVRGPPTAPYPHEYGYM